MTEGLPENDKGRMGLSIYAKDPNVVFASVEARPGVGVYKSIDRGITWEHMSETNNRPMYYSQIRVDPNDPERIYMGGSNLFRSSDGGRNFTSDAAAHTNRAIAIRQRIDASFRRSHATTRATGARATGPIRPRRRTPRQSPPSRR